MKLSEIIDKEADQNEIESKYLWNFRNSVFVRIDLSNLDIEYFAKIYKNISCYLTINNNKIFGVKLDGYSNNSRQFFLLDENFSIKTLETSQLSHYGHRLASCLYDDSIFIFENECTISKNMLRFRAKRYLISQDKWINLSCSSFYPYTCIGLKNKIIFTTECSEIVIYDIILDSYSQYTPFLPKLLKQKIFKKPGKLYLIAKSLSADNIYYCDDPLSEWTFVCKYDGILFEMSFSPLAYYNNSIYYFNDPFYYEFSLETFKTREVKFERS